MKEFMLSFSSRYGKLNRLQYLVRIFTLNVTMKLLGYLHPIFMMIYLPFFLWGIFRIVQQRLRDIGWNTDAWKVVLWIIAGVLVIPPLILLLTPGKKVE